VWGSQVRIGFVWLVVQKGAEIGPRSSKGPDGFVDKDLLEQPGWP